MVELFNVKFIRMEFFNFKRCIILVKKGYKFFKDK